MTIKQEKLIESYIRSKVKSMLKEDDAKPAIEIFAGREFENAKNSLNKVILSIVKTIDNNSSHPSIGKLREIRRSIRQIVDKLDYLQDDLDEFRG